MNYLEKIHLDAITSAEYDPSDKSPNYTGFSQKSAEITEQIAIEFAEWIADKEFRHYSNGWAILWGKGTYSSKELFEEFIKTKQ